MSTFRTRLMKLYAKSPRQYPQWFTDSIVAWYSPKRQGLTNDELIDEYPVFIGGLKDLSGNGHDLALYNMDGESGGYVDENGDLIFDGVDDYAQTLSSINSTINEITLITNAQISNETTNKNKVVLSVGDKNVSLRAGIPCVAIRNYGTRIYVDFPAANGAYLARNTDNKDARLALTIESDGVPEPLDIFNNIKSISYTQGYSMEVIDNYYITMGLCRNLEFADMIISSIFIFNKILTLEQATWIKNNLL